MESIDNITGIEKPQTVATGLEIHSFTNKKLGATYFFIDYGANLTRIRLEPKGKPTLAIKMWPTKDRHFDRSFFTKEGFIEDETVSETLMRRAIVESLDCMDDISADLELILEGKVN